MNYIYNSFNVFVGTNEILVSRIITMIHYIKNQRNMVAIQSFW